MAGYYLDHDPINYTIETSGYRMTKHIMIKTISIQNRFRVLFSKIYNHFANCVLYIWIV